ncbi:MAG: hypothetical protein CL610_08725 [Anaerolineaceae bacterium]|nr:hypothetical protein [Anaerolineaceae bacterium]
MTEKMLVFVGTYTNQPADGAEASEGIYVYQLDLASGAMQRVQTVPDMVNPTYLAFDPQQQYLYVANEVASYQGEPGGAVSAFRVDRASGELTFLNYQPSQGNGPCHVWVDAAGKWVLVANYGSGSVAAFPVLDDGSLGPASDAIQHEGSSVNPSRQEGPHAHCIMTDPTNQFALVADLGLDSLIVYELDSETGKLTRTSAAQAQPGAGPRHLEFDPSGRYCFLINELAATITVYRYEAGDLHEVQTISTEPDSFSGENTTAAIHVSPDGRYVYGSNRGHDSIAIFACDAETGILTLVGHQPTPGRTPRDFTIDPTGTYLITAQQDSHNMAVFRIDADTGLLSDTGHRAEVSMPVCLKVLPV